MEGQFLRPIEITFHLAGTNLIIIGIGLLFHMLTDFADCLLMDLNCKVWFS